MSHSRHTRRPQGARQPTQDQDRQNSAGILGTDTSYYTEDGIILSSASSQKPNLSRSTGKRRTTGGAPPRSQTTGTLDSIPSMGTDHYSSQHHIVESPESAYPSATRSNSDFPPFFSRGDRSTTHKSDQVIFASPSLSTTFFRHESEPEPMLPALDVGTGPTRSTSSILTMNPHLTQRSPSRVASIPRLMGDAPTSPQVPKVPISLINSSTRNDSEASNDTKQNSHQSHSRWDTIRKAVSPRSQSPTPSSSNAPFPSFRLTPAVSAVSSSSVQDTAPSFSIPKAGTALLALSDTPGLASSPSLASSALPSVLPNSRSARMVMKNVVDQMTGKGPSSAHNGLSGRMAALAMANALTESNASFARDIMNACWVARFGSATSTGLRRPARKATTDGGMTVPGGSALNMSRPSAKLQTSVAVEPQPVSKKGSLKLLHHIIVNNGSLGSPAPQMNTQSRVLPLQSLILSTLFIPFQAATPTARDEDNRASGGEQQLAIDIFLFIIRNWTSLAGFHEEIERWIWCCQVAACTSTTAPMRETLLGTLDELVTGPRPAFLRPQNLSAPEASLTSPLSEPAVLQAILRETYSIFPRVLSSEYSASQVLLGNLVAKLEQGDGGHRIPNLELNAIEREFGMLGGERVNERSLRSAIVTEAVVQLLNTGSEDLRRWYLLYFIEPRWPLQEFDNTSALLTHAHNRKINTFLSAILSIVRMGLQSPDLIRSTSMTIINLLQTRVIPEIEAMDRDATNRLRSKVVSILVELVGIEVAGEQASRSLLSRWLSEQGTWKAAIETEVKRIILEDDWHAITRNISSLKKNWSGNSGGFLSTSLFPALFERLVSNPPKDPPQDLSSLLISLAGDFPREYYKPLIHCGSSSSESVVSAQLRILTALSRLHPNFWIEDVNRMLVAMIGVSGSAAKGKQKAGETLKWGRAKLGQCVLFLELISLLRRLRKSRKDDSSEPPAAMSRATDFFLKMEAQLPILLAFKENAALFPFSMRLLVASLLKEIRLFTRSLKPAAWLPRMLDWGCSSHLGAVVSSSQDPSTPPDVPIGWTPVTEDVVSELDSTLASVRTVYAQSWLDPMGPSGNKATRTRFSVADPTPHTGHVTKSEELQQNLETLASLTSAPHAIFQLLVAVSGIIQDRDYHRLGPILWDHYLDSAEADTLGPIAFLIMQSAEKGSSSPIIVSVRNDLTGDSSFLKRRAIERLAKLFSWRYQVLTQPVITDRSHRRPFKSARPPLSFVPTDIGSTNYIPDRVQEAENVQFAATLPLEVRRRLIELGWDRNPTTEEQRPTRQAVPLSATPSDRLTAGDGISLAISGTESVQRGVIRRKSSGAGHGSGKKRPIFVASLAAELRLVLQLTISTNPEIANLARHFLLDTLRDEPALFVRFVFEELSELRNITNSITTLENTLRLQALLPPAFTFLIFNHLSGLLKTLARDQTSTVALMVYAYSLPSIANSVSHVSGMSIRELRKAKLDPMLLPSGSLWFSDHMIPTPMFPRSLPPSTDPLRPLPAPLVAITMVRTAQSVLLANLLKRDPKEVHSVRKVFTNFTLPALHHEAQGEDAPQLSSFWPKGRTELDTVSPSLEQRNLNLISLALARSHLLLVAQVFRCLNRQTNDYQEISHLLYSINSILLRHGNDLGIVTHSMIGYMLAMTRFRRMFSSNGGFMLIMPAVWKVYCEAEHGNKAIRDVIKYATSRFHAIHGEVFIFQSIDAAAAMISIPDAKDHESFASNLTSLLLSLAGQSKAGEMSAGGIQNVNRPYEREAIITSLNDSPDTLMSAISNGESMALMVDQFENKPFPLENLAKLFLTVIADDPFIVRAERFLVLFRFIVPSLYNNSMPARTVIREGIKALGSAVFNKPSLSRGEQSRSKVESPLPPSRQLQKDSSTHSMGTMFSRANDPSDFNAMKQQYLHLIVSFTKAGGQLQTDIIRRTLELLTSVLRDSSASSMQGVSLFLQELTQASLLRDTRPTPHDAISILSDIVPLIYSHGYAIDFSGVFDVLTQLLKEDQLMEDMNFRCMLERFCTAALDALEIAASSNTLRGVQFRQSFISLIVALSQLPHFDALSQLSGRSPSAGVLAALVLPVAQRIPSTTTVRGGTFGLRRAWLHLLGYALHVCRGFEQRNKIRDGGSGLEGQSSLRQGLQTSPRGMVAGLLLAIQVIKVIVIRAGEDIESVVPDVWLRIAGVIEDILKDGSGLFSLTGVTHDGSPLPSPAPSRPISPNQPLDYFGDMSAVMAPRIQEQAPRVVDYATWSILEMICFYRTPLNTRLRLWMQEKLARLETRRQSTGMSSGRPSPIRDPRRSSFSPFTKRRRSAALSAPPSPEGSPFSRTTNNAGTPPRLLLGSPNTISTFDRFPQASPPADGGVPRIRHLGPEFHLREARGTDGPSNPLRAAAKLVFISRPKLIQDSHRRVAAVRVFWGYEAFTGEDMSAFEAWTSQGALKKIVEETRELTREFHDITML